jgi:hypothetical protein
MSDTALETMLDDNAPSQPAAAEPVADPGPGVTPAAAPPAAAASPPPEGYAPLAVIQDERRKRQELERRVQEFERMLQQPKREPPPPPDWYTEPDKAAAYQAQALQAHVYETRVHLSQEFMRTQKPDYDEMEKIFSEDAERNPALWQQIQRHPMPAKFAYEYGRRQKMMREIGDDPDAYRQRVIAEWQASQGQQPEAAPTPSQPAPAARAPIPRSLASVPNNRPRDDRGRFQAPASLESILGD